MGMMAVASLLTSLGLSLPVLELESMARSRSSNAKTRKCVVKKIKLTPTLILIICDSKIIFKSIDKYICKKNLAKTRY